MKKILYGALSIFLLTAGVYTVSGEYTDSRIAKNNLSTMNKNHLFASIIETNQNFETFNANQKNNETVLKDKKVQSFKKIVQNSSKDTIKTTKKLSAKSLEKVSASKSKFKKDSKKINNSKSSKNTKNKTVKKKK